MLALGHVPCRKTGGKQQQREQQKGDMVAKTTQRDARGISTFAKKDKSSVAKLMPTKSALKLIRSLQQKKFRKEHGLFVAEGVKLAAELVDSRFTIRELYATNDWLQANPKGLDRIALVEAVSAKELSQLSSLRTPNEVVLVAEIPPQQAGATSLTGTLAIGLENLRDPGNLGTIIRLADWFGIETIVATPESVDVWNPKVVQATMGSIKRVQVIYQELDAFIEAATAADGSYPVMATVLGGENIYEAALPKNGLVLFGNESAGLSEVLADAATMKLAIPGTGGAESLNVGIACGVVCSEFFRRG